MKLGVISDIHADLQMLREAIHTLHTHRVREIVCCGDIVDGEPFPDETVSCLRSHDIRCVRGNHDRWAVGGTPPDLYDASSFGMHQRTTLWLSRLPTHLNLPDGVSVYHGRPGSDMSGVHPDDLDEIAMRVLLFAAAADVLLLGHTHVAFAARSGDKLIANPGSLCGRFGGTCAVLDTETHGFIVLNAKTGAEVQVPVLDFGTTPAKD